QNPIHRQQQFSVYRSSFPKFVSRKIEELAFRRSIHNPFLGHSEPGTGKQRCSDFVTKANNFLEISDLVVNGVRDFFGFLFSFYFSPSIPVQTRLVNETKASVRTLFGKTNTRLTTD